MSSTELGSENIKSLTLTDMKDIRLTQDVTLRPMYYSIIEAEEHSFILQILSIFSLPDIKKQQWKDMIVALIGVFIKL